MVQKRPFFFFHIFILSILSLSISPAAGATDSKGERNIQETFHSVHARNVAESNDEDNERDISVTGLINAIRPPDYRVQIAKNLLAFKRGKMTAFQFFRALGDMELKKEVRAVLMEVKKDFINYAGDDALKYFLGEIYEKGGTKVEADLLEWRQKYVLEAIKKVVKKFQGKNVVGGRKIHGYIADVGSWFKETRLQFKFPGDIDFNFVSSSRELAQAMENEFNRIVIEDLNMSARDLDAVCTAHGMATLEVYIGEQGRIFAERLMQEGKTRVRRIDFDGGVEGEQVHGKIALEEMAFEVMSRGDVGEIPKFHPDLAGPGIVLEMIRHFHRDLIRSPVFEDLDSFYKAAKFVDRGNIRVRDQGLSPDENLEKFAKDLLDAKKSGDMVKGARVIREYFGGDLPVAVKLGRTAHGKSDVTIKANEKFIGKFWDTCVKDLWKSQEMLFKKQVDDFEAQIRKVDSGELSAKSVEPALTKFWNIMEMGRLVLDHPHEGIPGGEIHSGYKSLLSRLEDLRKNFLRKHGEATLFPEDLKQFKFLEAQVKEGLKAEADMAMRKRLAMASLTYKYGKVADVAYAPFGAMNKMLDMLDDHSMGYLRGEREWKPFIRETRKVDAAVRAKKYLGVDVLPGGVERALSKAGKITRNIELWMNDKFFNNFVANRTRQINQFFGRSIQSSKAGDATIKALVVINLTKEIPAYVNAYEKDGWRALATEFFRRRVPFGHTVESYIMGNYGLAAWDFVCTIVPPLALASAAEGIGEEVGSWSLATYWSTELTLFIDTLYDKAEFKSGNLERYGDKLEIKQWKLTKVRYRGMEVTPEEYITQKENHIRKMKSALRVPHKRRTFPLVDEKDSITDWMKVDNILRENLRTTDVVLVMIDEMKKHPIVGPLMKDNLWDMWYTRWEQVKLKFVKKIIALLEERRAAEKLLVDGKLPEMMARLGKIGEELGIKTLIDLNLEKEAGSDAWKFLAWIRDWVVGKKRDYYEEARVWDVYKEGTRIVHKYLKTYTKILSARDRTEDPSLGGFAVSGRVDEGLRILTGPFFLTGKADTDAAIHGRWAFLPGKVRDLVRAELGRIKVKCQVTTPVGTADKDYDEAKLNAIVSHDVWCALWKHVQREAQPGKMGFLESIWKGMKDEEKPVGPDWQKLAPKRYRRHKEARDKLMKEYEIHYCVEKPKYLLWVERRGTWCWYMTGEDTKFNELKKDKIWAMKIDGPFDRSEEAEASYVRYSRGAKSMFILGYGKGCYHMVGGQVCFINCDASVDKPEDKKKKGHPPDIASPLGAREWRVYVKLEDREGMGIPGGRVFIPPNAADGKELSGGQYLLGPIKKIGGSSLSSIHIEAEATERTPKGELVKSHKKSASVALADRETIYVKIKFDFSLSGKDEEPPSFVKKSKTKSDEPPSFVTKSKTGTGKKRVDPPPPPKPKPRKRRPVIPPKTQPKPEKKPDPGKGSGCPEGKVTLFCAEFDEDLKDIEMSDDQYKSIFK